MGVTESDKPVVGGDKPTMGGGGGIQALVGNEFNIGGGGGMLEEEDWGCVSERGECVTEVGLRFEDSSEEGEIVVERRFEVGSLEVCPPEEK